MTFKVDRIMDGDGNWLLSGTDDFEVAKEYINSPENYCLTEMAEDADAPDDMDFELSFAPGSERGLWRKMPCACGDHGWHLVRTAKSGHGAFPGVYGYVIAIALEYEIDRLNELAELS